jgi:hypothetical protein
MSYEVQQAFNVIMEIPPIYRRDFIVDYLRKNLPEEDARRYLSNKTKATFLKKMVAEGFITRKEILEKIGKDRVGQFFSSPRTRV